MSTAAHGRPWSWRASIPPSTPRSYKIADPNTPPDAPPQVARPVASSTSMSQLRVEFVNFATKQLDQDETADITTNLEIAFNQLEPSQRRQVIARIREIVAREADVVNLEEALNRSLAIEAARPIWAQLARKSAVLATLLLTLDSLWNAAPKSDSTFGFILQQRLGQANDLRREAAVMRSKDPSTAAGGVPLFEAGMAQLTIKSQEQPRAYGTDLDWDRWRELESIRRSNAKPTGMARESLQSPDSTWRAIQSMDGGMGKIKVWAKDDDHGRIVDRVVLKDTQMSFAAWERETSWYGKGADNVPIEFWVHSKLSSGARYVLRLASRRVQVDDETRTYRMWMEYCPNGDLYELIVRHRRLNRPIPVEFILYVFKALVDASLVMKHGSIFAHKDDWEQIVHRDLKPENVFLGLPRATFNDYPEPKTADFGLAIVTDPDDPTNPALYNGGTGTNGYLTPEQRSFINPETGELVDDFQLLSACNVWGIGAIISDLMECNCKNSLTQPDYMPGGTWEYYLTPEVKNTYTGMDPAWGAEPNPHQDLFEMVNGCLKYQPEDRPTPEALRKWLSKKMVPMLTWLTKSGEHVSQTGDPRRFIEPKEQAHYVGMAFRDLLGSESASVGAQPFAAGGGGGGSGRGLKVTNSAPAIDGGGGGGGGGAGYKIMNLAPGDISSSAEAFLGRKS